MIKNIFSFLVFGLGILPVAGAQADSLILTYETYLDNILRHHPVAKKADLQLELAAAEALGARGNLDPVVAADWNEKDFKDDLYYWEYRAGVKVPTKLGVDIVGGYENTDGIYLNPEKNTSTYGLWHVGVEANLLQGLLVNERQTALEQAAVFQEMAANERLMLLNDLVYDASVAYLDWQQYFFNRQVLVENSEIAFTYFENTKASYFGGEKTGMDTLEAFILFQDALILLQKNEQGVLKARQKVENYLWLENAPAALQATARPEDYENPILETPDNFEVASLAGHPVIESYLNKLSYTEIAQRLKREKLKPKLKVKYHPLLSTGDNDISPNFSPDNYKWGLDFSVPILRRSEKAEVQRGEIKIKEIQLDIENKRNELFNKIENSRLQQFQLTEQLIALRQNVESYKRLLDGENEKFRYGESSVFLLNKRQEKYINGQLKLIELYIKRQLELLDFLYFSNQLLP